MFSAALKSAMKNKTLSKITVSEIIQTCRVNRKTFYYHFQDIYELLKWTLEQEAVEVVKNFDLLVNAEDAVAFVIDYVSTNQHILNCAYDSMGHEETKRFFYSDFIGVMQSVIENGVRQLKLNVSSEFKSLLADFYTEALAGSMLNWLKQREKYDKEEFIQDLLFICQNSIPYLLKKRAD